MLDYFSSADVPPYPSYLLVNKLIELTGLSLILQACFACVNVVPWYVYNNTLNAPLKKAFTNLNDQRFSKFGDGYSAIHVYIIVISMIQAVAFIVMTLWI